MGTSVHIGRDPSGARKRAPTVGVAITSVRQCGNNAGTRSARSGSSSRRIGSPGRGRVSSWARRRRRRRPTTPAATCAPATRASAARPTRSTPAPTSSTTTTRAWARTPRKCWPRRPRRIVSNRPRAWRASSATARATTSRWPSCRLKASRRCWRPGRIRCASWPRGPRSRTSSSSRTRARPSASATRTRIARSTRPTSSSSSSRPRRARASATSRKPGACCSRTS